MIAQTERLLLRRFHIRDLEAMVQIFANADVMRFGDGVQTTAWVQQWIATCLDQYYRQWGFGPYAVVERCNHEVIGYCGLFLTNINGESEIELGYRFARAKWRQGYATEAAQAVRDFAFETMSIKRLTAMIDPENHASIRVAEKLGMHHEAEVIFDGYSHPDRVYVVERL